MTQPKTSGPTQVPPFAAMLRAAVRTMFAAAPIIVLVFWVTRQTRGGLSALLGVGIAVAFFASGLYVMKRVTDANPLSILVGALAVYLGQVLFLGIVIVSLAGAAWLDGKAFGLSILAVALIWQFAQVLAFVRVRRPVYDEPVAEPAGAGESAAEPSGKGHS